MSATPDSTFTNPEQLIADLQCQLADVRWTLDQRTVERDEAQRQLAERTTERDEALAREAATAEVLQVINRPGDLVPVFDAMLEKAFRLCGAVQGALWLIDGERTRLAAARGLSADFVRLLRERGEFAPTPPLQRVMRGERIVHYLDTKESGLPFEEAAIAADVRTLIWVALVREGTPLGAFVIARREVRAFSEKEIALLQNFAAQAVIAMENARLITETREALEQQTATAEVLQVINSSPGDLTPVFDAMLDKAMRLCAADFGIMLTVDGAASRIVAERDVPEPLADFLAQHTPEIGPDTFFGRAVLGRSVLHTADMRGEAAYRSGQPLTLTAVDRAGVRALLMAPLLRDEGVSGVFAIFRREARPFSDKQIALLQNFAAQAVSRCSKISPPRR
jgi:GAF domain-containing protein